MYSAKVLTFNRRWPRAAVCLGTLACQLACTSAWAQSTTIAEAAVDRPESNSLEEVVVTARKRAENIQDVPASIVAISAATIEEAHMTQIDDIGSLVSNLHIVQRNDNSPDVTLRGVGSFGVVQGVGFYVDDVQQFEGQTLRPFDIERIEVLKGPQGTLYGGANIGGISRSGNRMRRDTCDCYHRRVGIQRKAQRRGAGVAKTVSLTCNYRVRTIRKPQRRE